MAYMNLMYRERGDVECDDLAARAEDLKTADHWVDETLARQESQSRKGSAEPGWRDHGGSAEIVFPTRNLNSSLFPWEGGFSISWFAIAVLCGRMKLPRYAGSAVT